MDWAFEYLKRTIKEILNFEPENYKVRPFTRRIRSRMRSVGIMEYSKYADFLKNHPEEVIKLKETLTINVSKFFRNPSVFSIIENEIFKRLSSPITIWSAGCASGEEPYTLSIILLESGKTGKIIATDVDASAIKKAQDGIYEKASLSETPPYIISRHFSRENGRYRVNDNVKEFVEFRILDLKELEEFKMIFDVIVCRNVLIYLSKEFQGELIKGFANHLKERGFLILGMVEGMFGIGEDFFVPYNLKERIYVKK